MKATEKADLLQQQVNSKVIWGARDREVLQRRASPSPSFISSPLYA
jgi:hypothetical protein